MLLPPGGETSLRGASTSESSWGIPQDLIERYLALADDTPEWWLDVVNVYYPNLFMWTGRLAEVRDSYERMLPIVHRWAVISGSSSSSPA